MNTIANDTHMMVIGPATPSDATTHQVAICERRADGWVRVALAFWSRAAGITNAMSVDWQAVPSDAVLADLSNLARKV